MFYLIFRHLKSSEALHWRKSKSQTPKSTWSPTKISKTTWRAKSLTITGIQSSRIALLLTKLLRKIKKLWATSWIFNIFSPKMPKITKTSRSSSSSNKIHTSTKLPSSDIWESIAGKCLLWRVIRLLGRRASGSPTRRKKSPIKKPDNQNWIKVKKLKAFLTFSLTGTHRINPNFKGPVILWSSWQIWLSWTV